MATSAGWHLASKTTLCRPSNLIGLGKGPLAFNCAHEDLARDVLAQDLKRLQLQLQLKALRQGASGDPTLATPASQLHGREPAAVSPCANGVNPQPEALGYGTKI